MSVHQKSEQYVTFQCQFVPLLVYKPFVLSANRLEIFLICEFSEGVFNLGLTYEIEKHIQTEKTPLYFMGFKMNQTEGLLEVGLGHTDLS